MIRTLLVLFISALSLSGLAQAKQERERPLTFYPLNIPYAVYEKFHTSIEFRVNELDNLLVGGHLNNKYYFDVPTNGGGFEIQYRANFNRDPKVHFRRTTYWGPFIEYDLYEPIEYTVIRESRLSLGLISGSKFEIRSSILLDFYYGVGLTRMVESYPSVEFNRGTAILKGGVQLGFKF